MLQEIVPKVTLLLEAPCTPSFLSLGIVTLRLRWVFAGHSEVGDELPGQGPQGIPALHMVFHGQFGWVVEIGKGLAGLATGQVDISLNGDNLGTPAFRVAHVR